MREGRDQRDGRGGTERQEKEWVRKERVTRTGHMYEDD